MFLFNLFKSFKPINCLLSSYYWKHPQFHPLIKWQQINLNKQQLLAKKLFKSSLLILMVCSNNSLLSNIIWFRYWLIFLGGFQFQNSLKLVPNTSSNNLSFTATQNMPKAIRGPIIQPKPIPANSVVIKVLPTDLSTLNVVSGILF